MSPLPPPRVAAIHDLSSLGRCALTVIIPTLSVMGYQVVPIPTALLSTHTGGFTDLHFRDLSDDMEAIGDHFSRLGTTFRAIYTGFLGSARQIETVSRMIARFGDTPDEGGQKPLVLIDPVMGDDGVLYSTYTNELMQGMKRLSKHASVLTPNLTEACFLTNTPYTDTKTMTEADAAALADLLLNKLSAITTGRTVITGIHLADGCVANIGRDTDGTRFCVKRPHEACSYPGTGDLFASILLGELLRGAAFGDACASAADFTCEAIRASAKISTEPRYGVALEPLLAKLTHPESNRKDSKHA